LDHLQALDNDIIDIRRSGYTEDGKILISLITVNGKSYSDNELLSFQDQLKSFLALSDVDDIAGEIGITLQNIEWHGVGGATGVDFRIDIASGYSEATVRKNIQIQLTKYFDFRFWKNTKIEWDDMLQIVKNVRGVKYVPDEYFVPNADATVATYKLPRIIKFIMRDLNGNVLYNNSSNILPIYYSA
jgi:hypothetical protein